MTDSKPANENQSSAQLEEFPLVGDEKSLQFLLREHERIASLYSGNVDSYHRRFDVWLAVFSAGFIGVVTFADKMSPPLRDVFVVSVVGALLALGLSVFMSLATSSVSSAHYERAIRRIQKCFTRRDQCVDAYLYFNHHTIGLTGTDFRSLARRGIAGGGLKSILVLANSAAASAMVVLFPKLIGLVYLVSPVAIAVAIFVILCCLHVTYAAWYYRLNGISQDSRRYWV